MRPLTDQTREALFNILSEKIVDSCFLDLFAGTGGVGIEALSRGAKLAFFVELNRQVAELIRQNLESTGLAENAEVYVLDVLRSLALFEKKEANFDIIFVGAPYAYTLLEKILLKISEINLLSQGGVLVAEHRKQNELGLSYGRLIKQREARYGETVLDFYKEEA